MIVWGASNVTLLVIATVNVEVPFVSGIGSGLAVTENVAESLSVIVTGTVAVERPLWLAVIWIVSATSTRLSSTAVIVAVTDDCVARSVSVVEASV